MCHCGECSGGLFWKSGPDAGSWRRAQRHHRWNSTACGAAEKVDSRRARSCCREARSSLMAFNFKWKKNVLFSRQSLGEPRAIRRGSSWLPQRKSQLTNSHTLSCLNLCCVNEKLSRMPGSRVGYHDSCCSDQCLPLVDAATAAGQRLMKSQRCF